MSLIDLCEIPQANVGGGKQDTFELFARDFLEARGFEILEGPGRGADRGRDMLVAERVRGTISEARKRWVVSAKHCAHSGRAVNDREEPDPGGRVNRFQAHGFMGFYSTLPSGGLDDTFARLKAQIEIHVYDRGRISTELVRRHELQHVFQQYLPESYRRWKNRDPQATKVWSEVTPLNCHRCGQDILLSDNSIVALSQRLDSDTGVNHICDVYWACKGKCDDALQRAQPQGYITAWEDLDDLRIPAMFIRWVCATLNRVGARMDVYEDDAFEKAKRFMLAMYQTVARETSDEQWERLQHLAQIPEWL